MIKFDKKIQAVLTEYHNRMEAEAALMQTLPHEEGIKRRDEFLLAVGMDTAIFLNTLVKASGAQTILEIGTSYGYSTIWLAEAARATGGKVITLEIDENKAAFAKAKIAEAGLAGFVDFRIGDALKSISDLGVGISDFVLVDIWKDQYVPCFELFFPKLNPGAYVIADNMLYPPAHKKEAEAYRKAVRETKAFDTVLLPIGSGIEVSCLR